MGRLAQLIQPRSFLIALYCSVVGCTPYYPDELPHEVCLLQAIPWIENFCVDLTDVGQMAILYNPDILLARDDVGVSEAQLFAAGLMPDPQLAVTTDFPTNFLSEAAIAYSIGITYDFKSLVLLPSAKEEAAAGADKIYLTLMWLEWQKVMEARLLYVKILQQRKALALLRETQNLLKEQYRTGQIALSNGWLANDLILLYLTALEDNTKQTNDLARDLLQNEYDLNALMGLEPDCQLNLCDIAIAPLECQPSLDYLAGILRCRADLLALQAGYHSQEWRVRKEVLNQLPDFTIGPTVARDNTGVDSIGYSLSMSVPVFNRNQGNIAVEYATRARLYDEYQTRLNRAYAEVKHLFAQERLYQQMLADIDEMLSQLKSIAQLSSQAYKEGNIDMPTYVSTQIAYLNKQVDHITAAQGLMETRITLQTLLGCHLQPGWLPISRTQRNREP